MVLFVEKMNILSESAFKLREVLHFKEPFYKKTNLKKRNPC